MTSDPTFKLMQEYKADSSEEKVDLCPGFYRDENAKPWVLPSVKKVRTQNLHIQNSSHSSAVEALTCILKVEMLTFVGKSLSPG